MVSRTGGHGNWTASWSWKNMVRLNSQTMEQQKRKKNKPANSKSEPEGGREGKREEVKCRGGVFEGGRGETRGVH